ncbi:hypothetical protein NHJ13051_009980, partial [Beauveria bassiana]
MNHMWGRSKRPIFNLQRHQKHQPHLSNFYRQSSPPFLPSFASPTGMNCSQNVLHRLQQPMRSSIRSITRPCCAARSPITTTTTTTTTTTAARPPPSSSSSSSSSSNRFFSTTRRTRAQKQAADDPNFVSTVDLDPTMIRPGRKHGPGLIIL